MLSSFCPPSRSLRHILDIQNLVKYGRITGRAEVPLNYRPKGNYFDGKLAATTSNNQYQMWLLSR